MKILNWIKLQFRKLTTVNKWLIVIMIILLTQSAHNLFANETISQTTSAIDTAVRTSSAAIFGYFISGNFIRKSHSSATSQSHGYNKIQVTIISLIGIISLAILLILRNFMETTPQAVATISQLRDFVSASVGFLVSCGKNSQDD